VFGLYGRQMLHNAVGSGTTAQDAAILLAAQTIPGVGEYRAFGIPGVFGRDVAECVGSECKRGACVGEGAVRQCFYSPTIRQALGCAKCLGCKKAVTARQAC
jgi:hypothetical protein